MPPGCRQALSGLLIAVGLLVVAAVVAYPWFSRARDRAMAASCLSNEKQIGLGLAMYCQDYEGKLPLYDNRSDPAYITSALGRSVKRRQPLLDPSHPGEVAKGALFIYLKNQCITTCPCDPSISRMRRRDHIHIPSYTFNGLFLGQTQKAIADPATKILLIDECSVSEYVFLSYTAPDYTLHHMEEPANFVHNSGLNCLYADGHAQWLNMKDWPVDATDPRFHAAPLPGRAR